MTRLDAARKRLQRYQKGRADASTSDRKMEVLLRKLKRGQEFQCRNSLSGDSPRCAVFGILEAIEVVVIGGLEPPTPAL